MAIFILKQLFSIIDIFQILKFLKVVLPSLKEKQTVKNSFEDVLFTGERIVKVSLITIEYIQEKLWVRGKFIFVVCGCLKQLYTNKL